jgi:hypothetical protein
LQLAIVVSAKKNKADGVLGVAIKRTAQHGLMFIFGPEFVIGGDLMPLKVDPASPVFNEWTG